MFEATSYFGIRTALASRVVDAIDAVGWGVVVCIYNCGNYFSRWSSSIKRNY
ncbi:hypothetical protein N2V83_03440 [Bacillus sp. FSL M7-1431]|uniref:hypothetical protein n=1 Tax=Bacillus sp. FSL M7-1431 TaxID=2978219 RepID=UPI0030F4EE30